jgi:hypothetical protein
MSIFLSSIAGIASGIIRDLLRPDPRETRYSRLMRYQVHTNEMRQLDSSRGCMTISSILWGGST